MSDMIDPIDPLDLITLENPKKENQPIYEDPFIVFGCNGEGECFLLDVLNGDRVDMSFWKDELIYFFEYDDFKFERGVYKCKMNCRSWLSHGWEGSEWEYETELLGEPEKIFDWGSLRKKDD